MSLSHRYSLHSCLLSTPLNTASFFILLFPFSYLLLSYFVSSLTISVSYPRPPFLLLFQVSMACEAAGSVITRCGCTALSLQLGTPPPSSSLPPLLPSHYPPLLPSHYPPSFLVTTPSFPLTTIYLALVPCFNTRF